MSFTSINFGYVVTTPRTQGRGDRSLIARSGSDRACETSGTVTLKILTVVTKLSSDHRSVRSKY